MLVLLVSFLLLLSSCAKNQVVYAPVQQQGTTTTHREVPTTAVEPALRTFYRNWKGTPYGRGGMSRSRVDCSGLTVLAYRQIYGHELPRTTKQQARQGKNISRRSLKAGDLVFFKTGLFQQHVGIYLDNSKFFHASASQGVMLSGLDDPYWRKHYWKATRPILR